MSTFALLLNSNNAANRSGASIVSYDYDITWANVIPDKYRNRKFNMSWTFRTDLQAAALPETILVACNFGSMYNVDQSGVASSVLGAVIPMQYSQAAVYYGYGSDLEQNNQYTCDYPRMQTVQVRLTDMTGASIAAFAVNYVLQLYFTLLDEEIE